MKHLVKIFWSLNRWLGFWLHINRWCWK